MVCDYVSVHAQLISSRLSSMWSARWKFGNDSLFCCALRKTMHLYLNIDKTFCIHDADAAIKNFDSEFYMQNCKC